MNGNEDLIDPSSLIVAYYQCIMKIKKHFETTFFEESKKLINAGEELEKLLNNALSEDSISGFNSKLSEVMTYIHQLEKSFESFKCDQEQIRISDDYLKELKELNFKLQSLTEVK